jgi:hypothetical protein
MNRQSGIVGNLRQLTKHHATKTYWGSGGTDPRIFRPWRLMEVSGQFHAPATLPPGKDPPVPIG